MLKLLFVILVFPIHLKAHNYNENFSLEECNKHEFKKVFVKIYNIYLCKENNLKLNYDNIYEENFSLIIDYHIKISQEKLISSTLTEISRYHKLSKVDKKYFTDKLIEIYPDIKKRDLFYAEYNKIHGLSFYHNKKFKGKITKQKQIIKFLDIWLHSPNHHQEMQQDLVY